MNIYKTTGELVLGTRFKRLSEKFLGDVSRVYKNLKIPFEPAWFPVFYLLNVRGELTVSELAGELEITHSGSSQMINSLEKKGLVQYKKNLKDKRVRTVLLTEKGAELLKEVRPIWLSIKSAMKEILSEGSETSKLLISLEELEASMQKKSLQERVIEKLSTEASPPHYHYQEYNESLERVFKELVMEWLSFHGKLKISVKDLVNEPESFNRQKGNNIILALTGNQGAGLLVTRSATEISANIKILFTSHIQSGEDIEEKLIKKALETLKKEGFQTLTACLGKGEEKKLMKLKNLGFVLQNISSDSRENFYINLKMELTGGNNDKKQRDFPLC